MGMFDTFVRLLYHQNDPVYLDKQVFSDSADADQDASKGVFDQSSLFLIQSAVFVTQQNFVVEILGQIPQLILVFKILGRLQYTVINIFFW